MERAITQHGRSVRVRRLLAGDVVPSSARQAAIQAARINQADSATGISPVQQYRRHPAFPGKATKHQELSNCFPKRDPGIDKKRENKRTGEKL